MTPTPEADVIVVGAGLAGLVATYELQRAGRRVLVVEQENRNNLGGQAYWSLGGLLFVDSLEQRRMGIKDSLDLALQDWMGSAAFDRLDDDDLWSRRWAEAYVAWAASGKRDYLHRLGLRFLPFVGWAERGDGRATGHGNSVPRFHLTWGTGPDVIRIFAEPVLEAEKGGLVTFAFRHRVDELLLDGDAVVGVRGTTLAPDDTLPRGIASSRDETGSFELRAGAVVVTSGGIGHNHDLMRRHWPTERVGPAPRHLISGVPAHVDGRMRAIIEAAGGRVVNRDRMWAYVEGIHNWDPIWPDHAIRILPGPSSMWFRRQRQTPRGHVRRARRRLERQPEADPRDRSRLLVVRAHPVDHREGVRPLRLGAKPRHHRQGRGVPAQEPAGEGRPGPGREVQAARCGLRRGRRPRPSRRRDERDLARPEARRRRHPATDRRSRPRAGQPLRQGRPAERDPQRPAVQDRSADPGRETAPDPRPDTRPADRCPPQHLVP